MGFRVLKLGFWFGGLRAEIGPDLSCGGELKHSQCLEFAREVSHSRGSPNERCATSRVLRIRGFMLEGFTSTVRNINSIPSIDANP